MAVINKDKYLRDIASLVHKDAVYFEAKDRPAVLIGGQQVFISSVGFDTDRGELTYKVCGGDGAERLSRNGERPLAGLDVRTLGEVSRTVRQYAALRLERDRNLVNVESRVFEATRKPVKGVSM